MTYQRENQRISATEILQEIANGSEIKCYKCTITGDFDVNRLFVAQENFDIFTANVKNENGTKVLTITEQIIFNTCHFEDNVCFSAPWDNPQELKVIFDKSVGFNSSVFDGQARFAKATFKDTAGFDGCTFNRICVFKDAAFNSQAFFRTVNFNGYGPFNGAVFFSDARFTDTCFAKGGNFTTVKFL